MKAVYILILVVLACSTAYGQSNLPTCQGNDPTNWNDCFGKVTWPSGEKYIGEWKSGKRHVGSITLLKDVSEYIMQPLLTNRWSGYIKIPAGKLYKSQVSYEGEWYTSNDGYFEANNAALRSKQEYPVGIFVPFNTARQAIPFVYHISFGANGYDYGSNIVVYKNIFSINASATQPDLNGVVTINIQANTDTSSLKINGEELGGKVDGNYTVKRVPRDGLNLIFNIVGEDFNGNSDSITISVANRKSNSKSSLSSQNSLAYCQGGDVTKWDNCSGTANYSGDKYSGEFRGGKKNGQGTYTYVMGDIYEGEFKDDLRDGQGTYYYLANNQNKGNKYIGEFKNNNINGQGTYFLADGRIYLGEWVEGKANGLFIKYRADKTIEYSGTFKNGQLIASHYIDPSSFRRISRSNTFPMVSDFQFQTIEEKEKQVELEAQRDNEERLKLTEVKRQRELAKQSNRILIIASATQTDSNGVVTINIQTNTDTSSLKINGEELGGKMDGNYTVKKVARIGQETKFTIAGIDVNGNTDSKTITVSRTVVESKVTYPELNPSLIKSQPERDAVAVIIGISNYKSLPKADYAKDDAQVFFDYAIRALGVKPGNIKLLMDEQADAEDIYTAFKTWLPARVKSTTDVYVFYSGHGLPTQDGSGLYLLPQRANRDLLSKTAILMQEINGDIQASKPKSVTIFMDACYSGTARGGETLVASARPIALKSQPTTFPSNFTVISASQADQISSSSPELQHGIFSYYLMRGMEGDADINKDGKITLDEIQAYLSENVGRQARIMNRQQEPQVIGDGSRVLVGR